MEKLFFQFRLGSFVPTQSCSISLESSSDSASEFVGNFKIPRLESEESGFEVFPINFIEKIFFQFRLGSFVPTQSCSISLESSSDSASEFVCYFKIPRLESEESGFEVFPIDFYGEGSIP